MAAKEKLLVVIPAYNEEATIAQVIKGVKKSVPRAKIVIVNDGSKDKTSIVAKRQRAEVLEHPFNLGIGGAVQTGLKYAKENGFEIAIQVDADGQHDPKDLPKLLQKLSGVDMVIGSRFLIKTAYKSSFLRRLGNRFFSWLILSTTGKKITDSTSGFRVFGPVAIDFFSNYYPAGFPEPRSIVTFLKSGYRIKEASCEMKKRQGGTSSVTPFKAIYLMFSISIAILFESVKAKGVTYE